MSTNFKNNFLINYKKRFRKKKISQTIFFSDTTQDLIKTIINTPICFKIIITGN